ncbi:hypothetical protein FRC00_003671 [Tulasnella sp. 408]|nr:hypothetical protein FRC00_003671 [Tulasnella sp. 408]
MTISKKQARMQILWAFCERVRLLLETLGPDDPKTIDAKETLRLVFALLKADERLDNNSKEREARPSEERHAGPSKPRRETRSKTTTRAKDSSKGPKKPSARTPKVSNAPRTKPKVDQPSGIKIRISVPQRREQGQLQTGTQPLVQRAVAHDDNDVISMDSGEHNEDNPAESLTIGQAQLAFPTSSGNGGDLESGAAMVNADVVEEDELANVDEEYRALWWDFIRLAPICFSRSSSSRELGQFKMPQIMYGTDSDSG